jgi:hypothetical protein
VRMAHDAFVALHVCVALGPELRGIQARFYDCNETTILLGPILNYTSVDFIFLFLFLFGLAYENTLGFVFWEVGYWGYRIRYPHTRSLQQCNCNGVL